MPKSDEFSEGMNEKLEMSRVRKGIIKAAVESIAVLTHAYDPIAPDAPRQYIINSYWKALVDSQSDTPRARRLRGDLR